VDVDRGGKSPARCRARWWGGVAKLSLGSSAVFLLAGSLPATSTGRPSQLRVRAVLAEIPADKPVAAGNDSAPQAAIASCDPAAVLALPAIPTTAPADDTNDACVVTPGRAIGKEKPRYLLAPVNPAAGSSVPAGLTGRDVTRAQAVFASVSGYALEVTLSSVGLDKENTLASYGLEHDSPQNEVAIVLNGEAIAVIDQLQPLGPDPKLLVVGKWSRDQARKFANTINQARRAHYQ
jgi:hypothetical protein